MNPQMTIDGEQFSNRRRNIGESVVHTANGWGIFSTKADLEGGFDTVLVRGLRVCNLVQELEICSKAFREQAGDSNIPKRRV